MEPRTSTPIEKWDEVNGNIQAPTQIAGVERDTNVMPMVTGDISQGERFTQLRESTGMNRKEFAEYLDIPYRTMQDWERDVRTMPAYVFSLIDELYYITRKRFPQVLSFAIFSHNYVLILYPDQRVRHYNLTALLPLHKAA